MRHSGRQLPDNRQFFGLINLRLESFKFRIIFYDYRTPRILAAAIRKAGHMEFYIDYLAALGLPFGIEYLWPPVIFCFFLYLLQLIEIFIPLRKEQCGRFAKHFLFGITEYLFGAFIPCDIFFLIVNHHNSSVGGVKNVFKVFLVQFKF